MNKKDMQKINDAVLENVEVPDSVLDMARAQMRAESPEPVSSPARKQKQAHFGTARGGAVTINRKAVAVLCACAVCAAIAVIALVAWLNRGTFNSSSGGSYYDLSLLTEIEITSVSDYNSENGTAYLCPEDGQTSTVLYSSGAYPVLFVENFMYGEINCTWYVVVGADDYLDILQNFGKNLTSTTDINGYKVYYNSTDGCQYAEFYYGVSRYCLSVESLNAQTAFEIIEYILG